MIHWTVSNHFTLTSQLWATMCCYHFKSPIKYSEVCGCKNNHKLVFTTSAKVKRVQILFRGTVGLYSLCCLADLWELWLSVPWPCDGTSCPTRVCDIPTHAGAQPSLVRIWVATPKRVVRWWSEGVHRLSLGLIGWELSNNHNGGEQGASLPRKINFNQRGDAILSNVKSTAALSPMLWQKIIPDSHLAT